MTQVKIKPKVDKKALEASKKMKAKTLAENGIVKK